MKLKNLIPAVLFLIPFTAIADEDAERMALVRLVGEIDSLHTIIKQARSQSLDSESKYEFDYAKLNGELGMIRASIVDHLNMQSTTPRQIPLYIESDEYSELVGGYTRSKQ